MARCKRRASEYDVTLDWIVGGSVIVVTSAAAAYWAACRLFDWGPRDT
jgi:hypothetical protein